MAKRKRLTPANPDFLGAAPEQKSMDGPLGGSGSGRAPIADVAADAAAAAAVQELSHELQSARAEGRMVVSLNLEQIDLGYLVRDRVALDDDDMNALVASIRDRGQQMPIEVTLLSGKNTQARYGLISGWRRCHAIAQLAANGESTGRVKALLRQPQDSAEAYLSMVEENEIRAGLSYFERARIAAKAVEQGVFDTPKAALLSLFGAASRAKRSKIRSFLSVVSALDGVLRFPQAIGERLGLALAKRLESDAGFGKTLRGILEESAAKTAAEEQEILAKAVSDTDKSPVIDTEIKVSKPTYSERELRPGLMVRVYRDDGRVQLWGKALTPALRAELLTWIERRK